jgi:transposase-like protein
MGSLKGVPHRKWTKEEKLRIVKMHLEEHIPILKIEKKEHVSIQPCKCLV